ncbi:MAG: LCP family protein, partial [Anaerolineae bacterium]|nr:LCP family protein [Anaerolineae bacterium]
MTVESWSNDDITIQTPSPTPSQPDYPIPPSYRPMPQRRDDFTPPPSLARESSARARMRRRKLRSRSRGSEWAWVIVAFALLSAVIVTSMSVALLVRASQTSGDAIPTNIAVLPTAVDVRADFTSLTTIEGGERVTLDDGRTITLTPWDGSSRFTILMMGLDRRPGETGLAYRTDTMMLVSIDPASDRIGILSIPRDLYV